MRRPVVASSSPRSIRSQSGSTLGRRAHRHRTVPACWQARDVPICRCWEKSARLQGLSKNQNTESCDLFHPRGHSAMARQTGTKLRIVAAEACGTVFGQTGTDRVGWYACPRRTLFATEWSAARRKRRPPPCCISAHNFCRCKGGPLPTSGRRKFPSGNFRSARDLEGAKRVSRGQAYRRTSTVPRLPERPYRTPPPPQPLRSVPVCSGIEECPH